MGSTVAISSRRALMISENPIVLVLLLCTVN